MTYQSTKTYGHELGFSTAFRQWRANSHCKLIHGYAMSFKFTFEAALLDERNWVVDFGGLKQLKKILEDLFDHTLIVAQDDPEIEWFREAVKKEIIDLVIFPDTGCEAFAHYVYLLAEKWLEDEGYTPRCRLVSVEVKEHGANSAIYIKE